jgi:hypothetical protein
MRAGRSIGATFALGLAAAAAAACDPPQAGSQSVRIESGSWVVSYRTRPDRIDVGRHFAVEIGICARAGAAEPQRLVVDAHMPEHRHGMNYRPSIVREGEGRYRADGLMFHMPGRWEFLFEVHSAGRVDRLAHVRQLD